MKKEDRRIQKTKAAISAALFDLLEEKDFDQISINDIADRAKVNRGTIYFHYADKFDLLDKIIEDRLEDLRAVCSPDSLGFYRKKNLNIISLRCINFLRITTGSSLS